MRRMMEDYSLMPVCERTRNKVAEMYRKLHEEIKRKGKQEKSASTSEKTFGTTKVTSKKSPYGSCRRIDRGGGCPQLGEKSNFNAENFKLRSEEVGLDDDDGMVGRRVDKCGVGNTLLRQGREESCCGLSFGGEKSGAAAVLSSRSGGKCSSSGSRGGFGVFTRSKLRFTLQDNGEDGDGGNDEEDDGEEESSHDADEGGVGLCTRTKSRFQLQDNGEEGDCSHDVHDEEEETEEEDNSDDDDDNIVSDSSEVESKPSSSSKDADLMNCEDWGAQKSENSIVAEDLRVEEEQEDEDEEIEINGSELEDDADIDNGDGDFVKRDLGKDDCVAKRTRLRISVEVGEKRMKNGTIKHSDQKRSDGAGERKIKHETISDSNGKRRGEADEDKLKHGIIKSSKKRKRGILALRDRELEKILVASILDEAERSLPSEIVSELPLKFTFGVEESPPREKLEEEKDLDKIWNEMALALSQNDVNEAQMAKNELDIPSEVEKATLCRQGNHQYILDEEIGIKCKYCSYVDVEIRYYVPPMSKHPWGRSERREYVRMEHDFCNNFEYEDFEFDFQSGFDTSPDLHGSVWNIIPSVRRGMHPHQVEGFEFLWKNIAGGIHLDDLKGPTSSNGGNGCVISHAPGTGKTRLTIAFLQTYFKLYPTCKPIIIAPRCMLQTWEMEFRKWQFEVPYHNLNNDKLSGNENEKVCKLLKPGNHGVKLIRLIKLYSWKMGSGVLALSYKLLEQFVEGDRKKNESSHMTEHDIWRKALLELPGLLVLDEGHTPRNNNSLRWKALSKIKTRRKIILSGTPFQNNFDELFNILCLVRPEFANKVSSKCCGARCGRRRKSDAREYWSSLTAKLADDGLKSHKLEKVRKMIAPFVHVHKGNILQERLPGLRDSVIILEPLGVQKNLLNKIRETMSQNTFFNGEHALSLVSVHPYLLIAKFNKMVGLDVDWRELENLRLDPEAGVKTKFLMELIRLSDLVNEKVLVFSQFLGPLELISKQLEAKFNWVKGSEILLMHGKCDENMRQASVKDFNDPKSLSKVMLASTRACSEGISLVGASRVVMLDVVWNPSVERQATSRAYRLGQEKVVYTYHLLTSETSGAMEEDKFHRQAEKNWLSEFLFYSADGSGGNKNISSMPSDNEDKLLEQMVTGYKLKHIFKEIFQAKDSNTVEA